MDLPARGGERVSGAVDNLLCFFGGEPTIDEEFDEDVEEAEVESGCCDIFDHTMFCVCMCNGKPRLLAKIIAMRRFQLLIKVYCLCRVLVALFVWLSENCCLVFPLFNLAYFSPPSQTPLITRLRISSSPFSFLGALSSSSFVGRPSLSSFSLPSSPIFVLRKLVVCFSFI
jgi:hypothetical protein